MSASSEDSYSYADHPLISYSNRIQKQMLIVTTILDNPMTLHSSKARPLRMLIANLPPSAKTALKGEWDKLVAFEKSEAAIDTPAAFEEIYSIISDWIYANILQDAFRAVPLNRKAGHIGESSTRVSDAPSIGGSA